MKALRWEMLVEFRKELIQLKMHEVHKYKLQIIENNQHSKMEMYVQNRIIFSTKIVVKEILMKHYQARNTQKGERVDKISIRLTLD